MLVYTFVLMRRSFQTIVFFFQASCLLIYSHKCPMGTVVPQKQWTKVAVKFFFIPFLHQSANSKLFELDLIFHHGTTMAVETEQFTSVNMVVPWNYLQMIWRNVAKTKTSLLWLSYKR